MFEMIFTAEILRFHWIARCHDIPAGAAAANVIERREFARHMIRLVIRRRSRGDEADMFGENGERRKQRQGSKDVTVALRLSASIGMFNTAR